jgi:hypothetical protein
MHRRIAVSIILFRIPECYCCALAIIWLYLLFSASLVLERWPTHCDNVIRALHIMSLMATGTQL